MRIGPDEDMHVHSTYSDGVGSLEENVAAAEALGLRRLGCVDHVRVDSDYLPRFVEHVDRVRASTRVELWVGVEAKLLDTEGRLDVPYLPAGVDRIYAADHQVPSARGPRSPREVRGKIASGELDRFDVIADLVDAYLGAIERYRGLVLAHPFSVLPKCGIRLDEVPLCFVDALALSCARNGAAIEIDERWRCPDARMVRRFLNRDVPVHASTDAHRPTDIGRYEYVTALFRALEASS